MKDESYTKFYSSLLPLPLLPQPNTTGIEVLIGGTDKRQHNCGVKQG